MTTWGTEIRNAVICKAAAVYAHEGIMSALESLHFKVGGINFRAASCFPMHKQKCAFSTCSDKN